ncbi:thioredoxin [Lichenibacterium minor]|uniref:Thioredoxin n=1 Tax=Lichenibacterium minor TaxID=2316528 RepID=A0A4Q2U9U6_9HYPH|nr:thioredoxin family protein [Lichenibacterium minor]RYC33330.1 thioredoxin [Lichenibacterium minor]
MTAPRRLAHPLAAALGLASALILPLAAAAAEVAPFTSAAFDAARAAGRPILVDVSAPWCPTCKAQRPILSNLEAQAKFKDLLVLDVDFDSQKDVLRRFGVRMQSTMIAFKGDRETARSTGETRPAPIAALLDSAL